MLTTGVETPSGSERASDRGEPWNGPTTDVRSAFPGLPPVKWSKLRPRMVREQWCVRQKQLLTEWADYRRSVDRNVAIIVLDSVRKDFFDAWADRIQEMADVSVDRAYAPSSWSTPSHASMFTGDLPSEHGIHTYHRSFADLPDEAVFLTDLDSHAMVGVSANSFAGGPYGFDRFFDSFEDVTPSRRFPGGLDPEEYGEGAYLQFLQEAVSKPNRARSVLNGIASLFHYKWEELPTRKLVDDGGKAVSRVVASDTGAASEPWLLFTNFMDGHIPLQHFRGLKHSIHGADFSWSSDQYDVWELMAGEYPEYWEVRERVYSAYVEYLDRIVADLIETLREQTERETTVIVTADHGENHGEESANGMANHKSSLSEQLLHVPLEIVNPPAGVLSLEEPISLLDLPELGASMATETGCDLSRDVIPAEVMGMSAGPEPPDDVDREFYTRAIRAAYDGETKIVWDSLGNCEQYRIDESVPSNQTFVEDEIAIPEWAREQFSAGIEDAVSEARSRRSSGEEVSAAVESRLEELGYK